MDIQTLIDAIGTKTAADFDSWLEDFDQDLSNYMYRQSGDDLYNIEFDSLFFSSITRSLAYKRFEKTGIASEWFARFLEMLAVAAERLALIGVESMLNNLQSSLPETGAKYRLKALLEFANVENVSKDYFKKLSIVLDLIENAQLVDEDNNIRSSVDILSFYIGKAKKAFENHGLGNHFQRLFDICSDEGLIARFPILEHPVILATLEGEDMFAMRAVEVFRDRLDPSPIIQQTFQSINEIYYAHPQINHSGGSWWGYDNNTILGEVLKRGRTDFRKGYGAITPDDKVLLYCFFNMKKHFYTTYAVFELVLPSLMQFFENSDYKPILIDLGCGPMTSGLALADLINSAVGTRLSLTYIGVDHAPAMLRRAKTFQISELFVESDFHYYEKWNEVDFGLLYNLAGKSNPVILNASYLFASESLLVDELADFVINISKIWEHVYFVFQNPATDIRNTKYIEFKSLVHHHLIKDGDETIRYKTVSGESSERVKYEILQIINPQ